MIARRLTKQLKAAVRCPIEKNLPRDLFLPYLEHHTGTEIGGLLPVATACAAKLGSGLGIQTPSKKMSPATKSRKPLCAPSAKMHKVLVAQLLALRHSFNSGRAKIFLDDPYPGVAA